METNATLTKLHKQFQKKHLQLSQITQKIDSFMQSYKIKHKQDNQKTNQTQQVEKQQDKNNYIKQKVILINKMKHLQKQLSTVKNQFTIVKQDLVTYSQLPSQFVRMVIQLPAVYQNYWEKRQQELMRSLEIRDEECKFFKQKVNEKQLQMLQLNKKLTQQNQINKQLCVQLAHKLCSVSQKQQHKISQNSYSHQNNKGNKKDEKNMVQSNKFTIKQLQKVKQPEQQQDLDSYIQNMEITIRQNDDPLFKKITQHDSQEEQESLQNQNSYVNHKLNNTARPSLILDLENSYQFAREGQKRKNSQTSFVQQLRDTNSKKKIALKADQFINKNLFWNKMTKNSQQSKTRNRKSLSQSKQNIQNKQLCKFTAAEKKILTSKITDFRKILFAEKGLQRLSFKM